VAPHWFGAVDGPVEAITLFGLHGVNGSTCTTELQVRPSGSPAPHRRHAVGIELRDGKRRKVQVATGRGCPVRRPTPAEAWS